MLRSFLSIPAVAVNLVLFCAIGVAIATVVAIIIPKPEYVMLQRTVRMTNSVSARLYG